MPGKVDKSSTAFIKTKQKLDRSFKKIQRNLQKELAGIEMGVNRGVEIVALKILVRALELVPKDTNQLADSGFIEGISTNPRSDQPDGINPLMLVGFDRNNEAPHAVFVHEINARHDSPTQWKFLSTAVNELTPQMLAIIKANAGIKKGAKGARKGKVK